MYNSTMAVPLAQLPLHLAEMAQAQALLAITPQGGSGQLKRAMKAEGVSDTEAVVRVPVFYARAYHDGRVARPNTLKIWYKDQRRDPRLAPFGGEYPEFEEQMRQLSPQEFHRDRALGLLIVAMNVSPFEGNPFFAEFGGMAGFSERATQEVKASFEAAISKAWADIRDLKI